MTEHTLGPGEYRITWVREGFDTLVANIEIGDHGDITVTSVNGKICINGKSITGHLTPQDDLELKLHVV